jgi:UPF0755 protein
MIKRIVAIVSIFNILLFSVAAWGISILLSPVNPTATTTQTFVVPKGAGVTTIGTLLEEKGLIRSRHVFRAVVWKNKLGPKIQAGTFDLSPSQSAEEIANALTQGTDDVWVTVVEGLRNEEVAASLKEQLGELFDEQEFLALAKPEQGFLFPDTYLVPKSATASFMFNLLRRTFDQKIGTELQEELASQGRTLEEAITLAALIEREARQPASMKMVSDILLKRLEADWPLQVDATLQYAKGYNTQEKTWWAHPLAVDKEIVSPYNTYAHPGLPPGPIVNPGLNAIMASIYPTSNEYWYYVTDPQGVMRYAKTLEEHNENVRKYLR